MYQIKFKKKAQKKLFKLPTKIIKKLVISIDNLADIPCPEGSKKLKGTDENIWRIRIGDYRVIYKIKVIEIRRIGHRKDIYK